MGLIDWEPRVSPGHKRSPDCSMAMCGMEPLTGDEIVSYWIEQYQEAQRNYASEADRGRNLSAQLRTLQREKEAAETTRDIMHRDRDHYATSADMYYDETQRFKRVLNERQLCHNHANPLPCSETDCKQWWE